MNDKLTLAYCIDFPHQSEVVEYEGENKKEYKYIDLKIASEALGLYNSVYELHHCAIHGNIPSPEMIKRARDIMNLAHDIK